MTRFLSRSGITISALLCLCGCDDPWPPRQEELSTHFEANEREMNRLVEKMKETGYVNITTGGMRGLPMPVDASNVSGSKNLDTLNEPINDDLEWSDLFAKTKMFAIRADSGVYELPLPLFVDLDDATYSARFVNGVPEEKYECAEKFRDLPCGKCYASANDSWGIEYRWGDRTINNDLLEQLESGLLDQESYESSANIAQHQCRNTGYREIGYSHEPPI